MFALVTISEIIFEFTKIATSNSLGPLSVSHHPFWSIWRRKKSKHQHTIPTRTHVSFKAMVNDDSQPKVFTLMSAVRHDRW